MKRILANLATLVVSTSTTLWAQSCTSTTSQTPSSANSIANGITSLQLNSFVKTASSLDDVMNALSSDILAQLLQVNFAPNVGFNLLAIANDLDLQPTDVINQATKRPLTTTSLEFAKKLQLNVTVTYNETKLPLAGVTLNVQNQTDQQISDYIKTFDFNACFQGPNLRKSFFIQMSKTNFLTGIEQYLLITLGSYQTSYITDPNAFNIINIKNGNNDVTQNDLNMMSDLKINILYQYQQLTIQTISFTIAINKLDITALLPTFNPVTVTLDQNTNDHLTADDVIKITTAIDMAILQGLNVIDPAITGATVNYQVIGISDIILVGANTTNAHLIVFSIIALDTSDLMTGTLTNQTIYLTVNNPETT